MTVRLIVALPAAETARLERHGDLALAVLPDCRLASAYADGTVRLWALARGAETAHMGGTAARRGRWWY